MMRTIKALVALVEAQSREITQVLVPIGTTPRDALTVALAEWRFQVVV